MSAFEPSTPEPREIGAEGTPGELLYHPEARAALIELRDAGFVVSGDVDVADLSATGTKDATTVLHGDNVFRIPAGGGGGGVTDHGSLTGLEDDDHPQYALADGSRGAFASSTHTHAAAQISDSTLVGQAVLTASSQAAARSAIGAGTSSLALGTTSTTAMAGNKTFTKADVGLSLVNNTSDLGKPISNATQAALDLKSNEGHSHTAGDISASEGAFDITLMAAGVLIVVFEPYPTTRPGRLDQPVQYTGVAQPSSTIMAEKDSWVRLAS